MDQQFHWPDWIKFDDTEADLNEARRIWLNVRGNREDGHIADFLEFMHAYADELEKRRKGIVAGSTGSVRPSLEDCG